MTPDRGKIVLAMTRCNHYLPDPLMKALRRLAKEAGVSVSELIRRAVEAFVKRPG